MACPKRGLTIFGEPSGPALPEPDLLTIQEVHVEVLNVTKETIKWYVKHEILHPVRLSARRIRFSRAELEHLVKEAGL